MSCVIYRPGKGHIEDGHECEMTTCEPEDLQNYLDSGWSTEPPGVGEQPQLAPESPEVYQNPEVEPNVSDEPEPNVADQDYEVRDVDAEPENDGVEDDQDPDLGSADEVRQAAKDAGISGWDTKRVKTLRKELEKK